MRAVDIIIKKRDQGELTREEIGFFINGFTSGDIPDYQAEKVCFCHPEFSSGSRNYLI